MAVSVWGARTLAEMCSAVRTFLVTALPPRVRERGSTARAQSSPYLAAARSAGGGGAFWLVGVKAGVCAQRAVTGLSVTVSLLGCCAFPYASTDLQRNRFKWQERSFCEMNDPNTSDDGITVQECALRAANVVQNALSVSAREGF